MVDANPGGFRYGGLGVERDTETGDADHVEIVRPVSHGDGLVLIQTPFIDEVEETLALGVLVDDGLGDRAGETVAIEFQNIRDRLVKADPPGEIIGEKGEAARDQRGVGAIGLHGLNQCAPTRSKGNRLAAHFLDDLAFQALEQGNAGVQRLREVQFTAHRAVGDLGHLWFDIQRGGEFVDTFLLDHGGIHVGNQQQFAAAFGRYEIGVNRLAGQDIPGDLQRIGRRGFENFAGYAVVLPVEFTAGFCDHSGGKGDAQFGVGGIGDQGQNRHGGSNFRRGDVTDQRRAVLIAGPTASGKSALALKRARVSGGLIVNADSMQVYDTLRIVTARPGPDEEALAEHRLYGHVPVTQRFSTGQWVRAVEAVIVEADVGRELIFVGGTGLYFDALTKGFADVPEVPEAVMLEVQQEIQALDEAGRMARLMAEDRQTAERLAVADPQRVIRALAVKRATGRALSSYQQDQRPGLLEDWSIERMVLWPERDLLRTRIARRFETMFESGAVEEVRAVLAKGLDPALPVMKAIGVPEISAWLAGTLSREEAIARSIIATHQYAKRQRTWFRNRMGDWPRVTA